MNVIRILLLRHSYTIISLVKHQIKTTFQRFLSVHYQKQRASLEQELSNVTVVFIIDLIILRMSEIILRMSKLISLIVKRGS